MLMTKFIGEPYAGKPHVRFDEGAGKEYFDPFPLYSTVSLAFFAVKILLRGFYITCSKSTSVTSSLPDLASPPVGGPCCSGPGWDVPEPVF